MIQGKEPGESVRGRFQPIHVDPFVRGFDMRLVQPLARSIRLNGFATCLRLEQVYWDILGDMAQLNNCSISSLLSHVDREVHLRHGGVRNFSGLVRVVCVVHGLKGAALEVADRH
ncbi:ribbon-helix-helix domain-containing protein [Pseudomonas sp. G2-4]|uniref:ribbon-helix-helix domain-containing protein n=1 Tax=Pseudomonas sp. G2-4 TaxID=1506334 RepID=UPI0024BAD400|nr:ribbon-helix-helix domain-containing protein [Pseudomonas sp. G2-4]WHS59205.1 ribbon-helix-helix domain-containing protein [Pseudomonas sp. G2-4]